MKRCSAGPSGAGSKTTSTVNCRQALDRVDVEDQAVARAVELDRVPGGRRDHARRADHADHVAPDALQVVERPHQRACAVRGAGRCAAAGDGCSVQRDVPAVAHGDRRAGFRRDRDAAQRDVLGVDGRQPARSPRCARRRARCRGSASRADPRASPPARRRGRGSASARCPGTAACLRSPASRAAARPSLRPPRSAPRRRSTC